MSFTPMPIMIGQRFHQLDGRNRDEVVTVVRLDRDAMGFPRITFQAPCGRQMCAYATQIEAAVAGGDLTPADNPLGVTMLDSRVAEKLAS